MAVSTRFIEWFGSVNRHSINSVGGKNSALGEMYQSLAPLGINIPNGFAINANAYWTVIDENKLRAKLIALMSEIDVNDVSVLATNAKQARELISQASLPRALESDIKAAYHKLEQEYGDDFSVAVRSSATAEDLPTASFAGQHETYLNISGEAALLQACLDCFASLFTDRAIVYRTNKGFDHFKVALSVGVMKMVRADKACSGVMFSLDTESGYRDAVFITGAYGLGENVVQGVVDPDEFYVHKPTYELGYRRVLSHRLGEKSIRMIYTNEDGVSSVENIKTDEQERQRFCLNDAEVLTLADYAIKTEMHFSESFGHLQPMDMEWAKDGIDGRLYLIQARPETVVSQLPTNELHTYKLADKATESATPIACGRAVGQRIASGSVRIIKNKEELSEFKVGEILVASSTHPDWVTVMSAASAVITEHGGRTCHAAIVARELGIPAVINVANIMELLHNGQTITVSCAEGVQGQLFEGALDFVTKTHDLDKLPTTKTDIMLNIASPDNAFRYSHLPAAGIGLARMEFIINNHIKAHPMALIHPEKTESKVIQAKLTKLIKPYSTGQDFFVAKLAEGIGMIAAAFYPRTVIVRFSDFKTNEYASLLGGQNFEPHEANPMLGFRGAVRYGHPDYEAGFALECAALKYAREEMGLSNIVPMVPFCRSIEEAENVIATMAKHGLSRGDSELQIYMMCEIPNNVICIDQFCELFDGISIGSNDLTQLVLGVDRDSDLVASEFNECDPGVLEMMRQAVLGAKSHNRYIGICGQAPSDFPEVAEFLVKLGINSISLNPDALLSILPIIAKIEETIKHNQKSQFSGQ